MGKKQGYSTEVKWQAIQLRKEGFSVKQIQKELNIKNGSQVYTWWYWYLKGETHRFDQPIGKQYSYGHGPKGKSLEETLKIQNTILENQIRLLKKYSEMERLWLKKYL